jgi:peptide-methionine (S)-S-oxide reductase
MARRRLNSSSVVLGMLMTAAGMLFVQRLSGATRAVTLPSPMLDIRMPAAKTETAVFAGGCFWGIQAVFEHTKGVTSAVSGYSGGWIDKPDYDMVSSGTTGHAESVEVTFDPARISYGQLLKIFFSVAHDPTQLNRQGPDVGTQYRSALFYMSDDQKKTAEAYIDQLNKAHVFSKPIVTQVVAYKAFFPAEAYHQDYAEKHPSEPYIVINDAPKVANLHKQFPDLYKESIH